MFKSAVDVIELTEKYSCRICDIVLMKESKISEKSKDEIRNKVKYTLEVMKQSAESGIDVPIKSVSGIIGGNAKKIEDYRKKGSTVCGDIINKAIARALSCSEVNAAMGKIVACPTAGSCGIVPAAIITSGEIINADEETLIDALLTASGVGQIIAKNATLSGAEGGCQAECGSASAMAAAAIVEMFGGTPKMAFNAAAIALKNILGLVCDPVAGLVEVPCSKRNAMGVVNAMSSADMALAEIESVIPFDEVVSAMYKVGKMLPSELRETALGGLAATPTAIKIAKEINKV
ncbi:L-serine ammonia-lyase, iron-sulfur-dependent, subunit alpha [Caloramator sp. E03]|uniref:L-serine ammonia-lyase, iron-sulfur-dependent, subunit alpha n=1 Tax=Caloramator sp. E03 TaxID=2576307 RepID=UPI0011106E3A|nr:L-serine ammonia-lyase, iron-sulfur-dependent, subunit alpha [Caloramator sp. E03]QCX34455.1 L-serine ammonia-lyase, iron-sulfur-dependent, subunit alpha [Caloramator sp. E03]